MKKMKLKEIYNLVELGLAKNITNYDFEDCNTLRLDHNFALLGIGQGAYGMNGALLQDEAGRLYAITAKTSALFQMV